MGGWVEVWVGRSRPSFGSLAEPQYDGPVLVFFAGLLILTALPSHLSVSVFWMLTLPPPASSSYLSWTFWGFRFFRFLCLFCPSLLFIFTAFHSLFSGSTLLGHAACLGSNFLCYFCCPPFSPTHLDLSLWKGKAYPGLHHD
jgi:hypothetical protein